MLEAPCKFTEDAENNFNGVTLTVGINEVKLLVERGIRIEDTEYNLRGEIITFNLLVAIIQWLLKYHQVISGIHIGYYD